MPKQRSEVLGMAIEILIVDDERDIRDLVAGVLSDEGYDCRTAGDSISALAAIDERRPSLLLLDVWLHGSPMDGLEVLDAVKQREPDLPVIIFSGHGNIDTAVAAISRGAVDFIEKPFEAEKLLHLVARATETERLRRENAQLRQDFSNAEEFTGNSAAINQVRATLKRVANTGSRLLISGPAGAGKEVAARLLHSWSPRAQSAFVSVNSARITPERFEQELFGEERDGSLVRPGLLEMADGGTLYFDEVADMPLSTQARILRVLTEQSFVRVGGNRQIRVDVRVLSSTSRCLETEIAEHRFREDLFYRLNVVPVPVPALTERREDIPVLVEHFFARYAAKQNVPAPTVSEEAMTALQAYEWPGNVRQLRNEVQRAVAMASPAGLITPDLLSSALAATADPTDSAPRTRGRRKNLAAAVEELEREMIEGALERSGGNISETARILGLTRRGLYLKMQRLGVSGAKAEV